MSASTAVGCMLWLNVAARRDCLTCIECCPQVFSEAENRMHAQNGILLHALDSLAGL